MDKDLDDLLESALGDFDKKTTPIPASSNNQTGLGSVTIEKTNLYVDDIDYDDRPARSTKNLPSSFLTSKTFPNTTSSSSSQPSTSAQVNSNLDDEMKLFEEIFNDEKTKESMKQFTDAFNMFQTSGDEQKLLENFQKVMSQLNIEESDDDNENNENDDLNFFKNLTSVAAAAAQSSKNTTDNNNNKNKNDIEEEASTSPKPDSNNNKSNPYNKVLDDLNKNSEKVFKNASNNSNNPFGSDFFSTLLSGANNFDDTGLGGTSSLMMEPILTMLFSKDILYPSLKMMMENYDKYIEERKDKLSQEELTKLKEQQKCINEMCSIYESQKEDDNSEIKSEQLKKILDLLEKCGMPPNELVPEVNPFEALGDIKPNSCPLS